MYLLAYCNWETTGVSYELKNAKIRCANDSNKGPWTHKYKQQSRPGLPVMRLPKVRKARRE